ncbi:MAG: hypothetical protein E7411_05305 [Ruminococcaceae bacterium]|nr:hypothetical protein [Oscillospiraceae bacterium]
MICSKCGFDNKEEAKICASCNEPLNNEEKNESTVLDRILALSGFTFCVVFLLSFLLLLFLFLFR